MREHLKFKQLLNQFKSLKFEEEYVKDFLMEANEDFEESFDNYLKENGITMDDLEGPKQDPAPVVVDDGQLHE